MIRIALALSFASILPAQAPCSLCPGSGVIDCIRCDVSLEAGVEHCSVAAKCVRCRGAGITRCDCASIVPKSIARRRAFVQQWLALHRGKDVMRCRTTHFDLTFAPGQIRGSASSDPHRQMHLLAARLERTRARFAEVLGLAPTDRSTADRIRVHLAKSIRAHRSVCASSIGVSHQGIGVKRFGRRAGLALHHDARSLSDDRQLHRTVVHNLVHLLISRVPTMIERHAVSTVRPRSSPGGGGWLDAGLAHWFEADLVDGKCSNVCYLERAQPPTSFGKGDWHSVARRLLRDRRLPALATLLDQDTSDLDFEEHVVCFEFVDFLIDAHGGAKVGALLLAMKKGEKSESALRASLSRSISELESAFRARLARGSRSSVTQVERSDGGTVLRRRHAALYIYTRPPIRPRHQAIVTKALERRAAAHESGWRKSRKHGTPELAIGPVQGRVFHWKRGRTIKSIPAAWPFAAVLEYEPGEKNGDTDRRPRAYLDWYRRRRHSRDPGAWFHDPAGDYVDHLNAEIVHGEDDRFHYMAVVDTPTGDVIGSSEFAVRARVRFLGGESMLKGWWIRLAPRRGKPTRTWTETLVPLVDWRVVAKQVDRVERLPLDGDEMAIWGSARVFRFPRVLPGLRPGR